MYRLGFGFLHKGILSCDKKNLLLITEETFQRKKMQVGKHNSPSRVPSCPVGAFFFCSAVTKPGFRVGKT